VGNGEGAAAALRVGWGLGLGHRPHRLYTGQGVRGGARGDGRLGPPPCLVKKAVPARRLDRRPRHGLCRRAVPARARLHTGRAVLGPGRKSCPVPGRRAAGCMEIYSPTPHTCKQTRPWILQVHSFYRAI